MSGDSQQLALTIPVMPTKWSPARPAAPGTKMATCKLSSSAGMVIAQDASYQSRGILMKGLIVIAIGFVFTTVLFLVGLNVWGV